METIKSKDWVDNFEPIMDLRNMLKACLDEYKKYWHQEGVMDWDYELKEMVIGNEYVLEVNCGRKIKTCILRESSLMLPDLEFAEQAFARLRVWRKFVQSFLLAGVVNVYRETIKMYRGHHHSMGVPHHKNPLTPSECLKA